MSRAVCAIPSTAIRSPASSSWHRHTSAATWSQVARLPERRASAAAADSSSGVPPADDTDLVTARRALSRGLCPLESPRSH
jgi:hypothetical protein